MSSQNLDFPVYLNAKMEYITHSLQKKIKTSFSKVKMADCELGKSNLRNRLAIAGKNDVHYYQPVKGFY